MKDLKEYIKESILDDIEDQLDNTDEMIKNSITRWIKDNVKSIQENKLKFDFSTKPVTVNCDSHIIEFKENIAALTNGAFQWGEIKGYFICDRCKSLKSLEGAPKDVRGGFDCSHCNSLKSLEGGPEKVSVDFYCYNCNSLKSLEGAPKKVGGDFTCSHCNSLKSLEGAPEEVRGNFYCHDCKSLKSLKGAPKEVGRDFHCSYCESLESLEGAPKKVGRDFICGKCGVQFTEDDVKKVSNVKGEITC